MFKDLKDYKNILVTGPRRSGTRIATKMIAHDTGHQYVDEADFNVSDMEKFGEYVNGDSPVVLQCPGMSHIVHEYTHEDTLIIMLLRSIEGIVESQTRVNWHWWNKKNFKKYPEAVRKIKRRDSFASMVYNYWYEVQKKKIINLFELKYESMAQHPLWIAKEKRVNFEATQTK